MRIPDLIVKLLLLFFGPNVFLVLVAFGEISISPRYLFGDNLTRPWVGCTCQFVSSFYVASAFLKLIPNQIHLHLHQFVDGFSLKKYIFDQQVRRVWV